MSVMKLKGIRIGNVIYEFDIGLPITKEVGDSVEEAEIKIGNDQSTDIYVKINKRGLYAKQLYVGVGDNAQTIQQLIASSIPAYSGGSGGSLPINIDHRIASENGNNPIAIIKETPGLTAILHSWGFIGDSLSSGYPNNYLFQNDGSGYVKDSQHFPNGFVNFYEYSWGQMMCRLMGTEGANYSNGGQTTHGWLDRYPNQTVSTYNTDGTDNVNFSSSKHNAYAIMLGTNDKTEGFPLGDVDTDIDIEHPENNNLNTYAGCYGKIISLCKEQSPSAKIFLITCPVFENGAAEPEYNDVVRLIADKFTNHAVNQSTHTNVFLVDLAANFTSAQNNELRTLYGSGHSYTQGYMYFAYAFMTYVDYIIRTNPLSFASVYAMDTALFDNGKL